MSTAAKSLTIHDKLMRLERKLENLTKNAELSSNTSLNKGNDEKFLMQEDCEKSDHMQDTNEDSSAVHQPSTSSKSSLTVSRLDIVPNKQREERTFSLSLKRPPPLFDQTDQQREAKIDKSNKNNHHHRSKSTFEISSAKKSAFVLASNDAVQTRFNEKRLEEITKQTGILKLNDKEYKLEPHELIQVGSLGHGTCGHVVKMFHSQTGSFMAVKQMRRSGNKEENKRIITDLDVVLRSHDCPYIVHCFGCFITDSEVWICMELMATCLDKLIKSLQRGLPERILGKITVSVLYALDYLKEKQGIIHRDVKPSNILLDCNGTVKLCDFGISGRLVDSKVRSRTAGCMAYLAPERIEPINVDYDVRADVWSMGISLIELATGRFPYGNCKTDFELLAKIVQEDPPCLSMQHGFSRAFYEFTQKCLTKNVEHRPKFKDLLKTDFVKYYELNEVDVGSWFEHTGKEINDKQNFM